MKGSTCCRLTTAFLTLSLLDVPFRCIHRSHLVVYLAVVGRTALADQHRALRTGTRIPLDQTILRRAEHLLDPAPGSLNGVSPASCASGITTHYLTPEIFSPHFSPRARTTCGVAARRAREG